MNKQGPVLAIQYQVWQRSLVTNKLFIIICGISINDTHIFCNNEVETLGRLFLG